MLADTVSITPANNTRTRSPHQLHFNNLSCNTSQLKDRSILRTMLQWNTLSQTVVNMETVVCFKVKLIRQPDQSTIVHNHPSTHKAILQVLWIIYPDAELHMLLAHTNLIHKLHCSICYMYIMNGSQCICFPLLLYYLFGLVVKNIHSN